jgi:hypothetical protein
MSRPLTLRRSTAVRTALTVALLALGALLTVFPLLAAIT